MSEGRTTVSGRVIERVLGVYAHPDDVDFGAGATLATLIDEGVTATIVVVTSGGEGGFDPTHRDDMQTRRRTEQRAASAALGIDDVRFLDGYEDGNVTVERRLIRNLTAVIRDVRPTLVLTTSPERNWASVGESHPDHLAVGEATQRAIYPAARNPFAFAELLERGLAPWVVDEVWLQGHPTTNHVVPVSAAALDRKLDALAAHKSQLPDPNQIRAWVRDHARDVAAGAQSPEFAAGTPARREFAEAFFRADVRGHD